MLQIIVPGRTGSSTHHGSQSWHTSRNYIAQAGSTQIMSGHHRHWPEYFSLASQTTKLCSNSSSINSTAYHLNVPHHQKASQADQLDKPLSTNHAFVKAANRRIKPIRSIHENLRTYRYPIRRYTNQMTNISIMAGEWGGLIISMRFLE